MNTIQSTLFHKIIPPRNSLSKTSPALVFLHGRGSNEDDLLSLNEFLDDRFFFISVRAPYPFQYSGGYTWYDVPEIGKPEPKMFTESYNRLVQFHDDIVKGYPIDQRKIFYFGFSMGTIMSFALSLSKPELVRGVVANGGYIPEDSNLKFHWDKLKNTSFFVAHGIYDSVISIKFAHRAKYLLEQAGADLTYREYSMGHQISEESLNDISQWLTNKLDSNKYDSTS